MRAGFNDTKDAKADFGIKRHRVVLPVYIPRLDGYFSHSLEILRLCLRSIVLTGAENVSITLVANQCCPEALADLQRYYRDGWIDQLVVNVENRGRVDGMLSQARASYEEIITCSDADVLFKAGWTQALDEIFGAFPECAVTTLVPHPGAAWKNTVTTVLGAWLRRELSFEKVVPDVDIDRHGASIGRMDYVKPEQRAMQVIVRRGTTMACVGAQHFVFSIRRDALSCLPRDASLRPLGGLSDEFWIDRPPDREGYWRLATPRAYASHMGNIPEPWMYEELEGLSDAAPRENGALIALKPVRRAIEGRISWRVRALLALGLKKVWLEREFSRRARKAAGTTLRERETAGSTVNSTPQG